MEHISVRVKLVTVTVFISAVSELFYYDPPLNRQQDFTS